MTTVAVMQPYFLPYIGYWQLLAAADIFVILDDVNFITRGYINRNSILLNGAPHLFTLPLKKASQNNLINETKMDFSSAAREKLLKTIKSAYLKAPFFQNVWPMLEDIINLKTDDLVEYISHSFSSIGKYVGQNFNLTLSSQMPKDSTLKGAERILDICRALKAVTYINAPGGRKLYGRNEFSAKGFNLKFLKPGEIKYRQFSDDFTANLSIIDILMFNEPARINAFLEDYTLE